MIANGPAVHVEELAFHYGSRCALADISLEIAPAVLFGLLGPNGSGKTTLFRILTTLLPVQRGRVTLAGADVNTEASLVRARIGVTFQSPSLDGKLTVRENLYHQGHLYGLSGRRLKARIEELLAVFRLSERAKDLVEVLSGGLKRRVEIAKSLLHKPPVLLLDEPGTGLDPAARRELWNHLEGLRNEAGMTIVVTTHLMDEAERCDRLAILDRGRLVAAGSPADLKATVGGSCVSIETPHAESLAAAIRTRFGLEVQQIDGTLRIEHPQGHELLRDLVAAFPDEIDSVSLSRPTLEDVFMARTGHRFDDT